MTTKKTTAVATTAPGAIAEYKAFAGKGWDNVTSADIAIPFLNLLQDGSPQVKKSSAARLDGAEAGFFVDSVSNDLFDGEKGIVVIPVLTQIKIVEWIPYDDGGAGKGPVGIHEFNSPIHQAAQARAQGDITKMVSEDGSTELKETFYMYALILREEDDVEPVNAGMMIAFSKSKVKPYRNGMARINMVPGSRTELPLFCNRLRLTSVPDSGQGNDFFNVKLEPIVADTGSGIQNVIQSRIPPTLDGQPHPLLVLGEKFYEGLIAGTVKVDFTQQASEGSAKGDGAEVKDKHF